MINDTVRKTFRGGREMTQEELQDFKRRIRYGTLAYITEEGIPDMRPLNLGLYNDCYYFHAGKVKGEKLRHLTSGKDVCLSLYTLSERIGVDHICTHESVLVYGTLERLDVCFEQNHDEMVAALTAVSVAGGSAYKAAPDRLVNCMKGTAVFKIIPKHTVGKLVCFATTPD